MNRESLTYRKFKSILVEKENKNEIKDLECFGTYFSFYDNVHKKQFQIRPAQKQRNAWFKSIGAYSPFGRNQIGIYVPSYVRINYKEILNAAFKFMDKELLTTITEIVFFWNEKDLRELCWGYSGAKICNTINIEEDYYKYVPENDICLINMNLIFKDFIYEKQCEDTNELLNIIFENLFHVLYESAKNNPYISKKYVTYDFSKENIDWILIKKIHDVKRIINVHNVLTINYINFRESNRKFFFKQA